VKSWQILVTASFLATVTHFNIFFFCKQTPDKNEEKKLGDIFLASSASLSLLDLNSFFCRFDLFTP